MHCFPTRSLRRYMAVFCALLLPVTAQAGIIRDAEIEDSLRRFSTPIFQAAQIDPQSVRIMVVGNPEINAYVAGGLNIFIHTGLIRATENPGMLIGVIAHETGHISGAHLSQLREKSSRAALGGLIGTAIGAAASIGGGGKAGAGIMAASQTMAQRRFLGDIRLNEQAADHAALRFMEENEFSATGMLEMFESLHRRELGGSKRDPFLTDHPLSTERIATLRNHIAASPIPAGQMPRAYGDMHARMVAKLVAFTEPYETTLRLYPTSNNSVAARYARAIAQFRRSRYAEAIAEMEALIAQYPKDPYFYDTKGQIQFEHGKLAEAATSYANAARLKPDSALIKTDYARALIAQDAPALLPQAVALLEQAREIDDSYGMTWRQLAIAYGKQGKLAQSYASLAEESALLGDTGTVLQHVARARGYSGNDARLQLQLDDLEHDAKAQREQKKRAQEPF